MKLPRRDFLGMQAAALTGVASTAFVAPGALAASLPPRARPSRAGGFYRFSLGELQFTVLTDGSFRLPSALPDLDTSPHEFLAFNADAEVREEYFRARMVPEDDLPLEANPVVIDSGGRRILVDTGWAGETAPGTSGRLGQAMRAAGIEPGSIDVIVLTHGHPDHLGGIFDSAAQQLLFPNAEVVLSRVEHELWMGPDSEARLGHLPLPLPMIQGVLRALEDRLRLVGPGDDVAPGIRTMATPGHTPGHISLLAESAGRTLLLSGDALTMVHVHFEQPDWLNMFDHDPEEASLTRRRILDMASTDDVLILGYHLPFPGLGHAIQDGDAWRWYPIRTETLP